MRDLTHPDLDPIQTLHSAMSSELGIVGVPSSHQPTALFPYSKYANPVLPISSHLEKLAESPT